MRRLWLFGLLLLGAACLSFTACGSNSDNPPPLADGDGENEEAQAENEAEADSEAGPQPYPTEPASRVVYEVHGPTSTDGNTTCNRLPFPYNYFLKDDPTAVSGKRINLAMPPAKYLPCTNSVLIDDGLRAINTRYIAHVNSIDGFSTFGLWLFEVSQELDPASLPATPEASAAAGSTVALINLTKSDADFGARIPIRIEQKEAVDTKKNHLFWYVVVRPTTPLKGLSTYALVLQQGLKGKDGTALAASAHFQIVSGQVAIEPTWSEDTTLLAAERDRLTPTLSALTSAPIGLAREKLLLAVDASTQSVEHDMTTIAEQYDSGALPAAAPNFDVTGDGKSDLFTAENLDTFPKDVPGISGSHWENIAAALRGTFRSVDFRAQDGDTSLPNRKRDFRYDEHGKPVPQNKDARIPVVIFFPKTGSEPFPVVIMQHGIYSSKESMYGIMGSTLKQGYAVALMDFPYHGERENEGVAIPPLEFIDFSYPLKARAAFMQGSLDQMQLVRLLAGWKDDLFPAGGNGKPDIDTTRIGYLGHSLGGIVGTLTFSLSKSMSNFVSIAGGGGLVDFLGYFMTSYGLGVAFPDYQLTQFAAAMQTVLDAGDNINYVRHISKNPIAGAPKKSFLLQEMGGFSEKQEDGTTKTQVGDEVVPNVASENDARTMDLPQLKPIVHEVWGITPTEGPLSALGISQFYPATHQTIDSTYPETRARMVKQSQHFFKTSFETGTGEIIAVPVEVRR